MAVGDGELWGDKETGRQGEEETGAESPIPNPQSPLFAVFLLVASPSFVFWSRQGIFVTNLTQPLTLLCVWMGLRWLRTGRSGALILSGLAAGLALYAKLLAVWIVGPFGLMMGGWWLWRRFWEKRRPDRIEKRVPRPTMGVWVGTGAAFGLGLLPLILFNVQTGGTFSSVGGNLGQSYYGVDNANILANLPVRLGQVVNTLEGDHFWYLGGLYANRLAPWLALIAVIIGLIRRPRTILPPLILLGLAVIASLFTVSDLFITHYALLHPFMVAVVALGIGDWGTGSRDWGVGIGDSEVGDHKFSIFNFQFSIKKSPPIPNPQSPTPHPPHPPLADLRPLRHGELSPGADPQRRPGGPFGRHLSPGLSPALQRPGRAHCPGLGHGRPRCNSSPRGRCGPSKSSAMTP